MALSVSGALACCVGALDLEHLGCDLEDLVGASFKHFHHYIFILNT